MDIFSLYSHFHYGLFARPQRPVFSCNGALFHAHRHFLPAHKQRYAGGTQCWLFWRRARMILFLRAGRIQRTGFDVAQAQTLFCLSPVPQVRPPECAKVSHC